MKMKFAIIIGIIQMMLGKITILNCKGILLKGLNARFFGNWLEFWFEFIPQIVFMASIFFYTIVMIFFKWSINWNLIGTDKAPSIISQLLNIFINLGSVVSEKK